MGFDFNLNSPIYYPLSIPPNSPTFLSGSLIFPLLPVEFSCTEVVCLILWVRFFMMLVVVLQLLQFGFLQCLSFLQKSFNNGCCLYCIWLFTEFFCNLSPPCATIEMVRLVYGSFGTMDEYHCLLFGHFRPLFVYALYFLFWTILLGCLPLYSRLIM